MSKEYLDIASVLKEEMIGRDVCVRGWIHRRSVVGGKAFIRVRDSTGTIQIVLARGVFDDELLDRVKNIGLEASVEVCGIVRSEERAPGGFEIEAKFFRIIGDSKDFPIKGYEGIEYLLDNRHLWIRSKYMVDLLKIKHTVMKAGREYFVNNGWWETTPPILTASACEGGATLFPVQYYEKTVYLSQSAQLYLEALIFSLEKVWSLTPSFRAEKSRTRRHLTEYWHLEAEAAWYSMDDMMRVVEELISYIVERVVEERRRELDGLGRDVSKLKKALQTPYPRIKYGEAIEILQRKGVDVKWGDDLGADEERALAMEFEQPFFITHFPKWIKSFYMKVSDEDDRVVLGFDLLAPEGYGEIVGGGQREDNYDRLVERIREQGLRVEDYAWYLDLRRYGSVPHSGFGLGIERAVMWIAGLDHIRDATPFPRFRGWVSP